MFMSQIKIAIIILFFTLSGMTATAQTGFVKVKGHNFMIGTRPYHYIGANYWYGGLLSVVKGEAGKKRLQTELDFLKKNGITNLRVMVGAEGLSTYSFRVRESNQPEQGVYDDKLLTGLDYLLQQMGKRDMKAVLFLTNTWEWSGGFGQYLQWNGYGPQPLPHTPEYNWDKSKAYITQFFTCDNCRDALNNYIKHIISRINTYTHKKYTRDAAIMAWELCNEPRPMGTANTPLYVQWISQTAALIKSMDKNHLVTTGSEGDIATDNNIDIYQAVHADKNIDYLTIHIWPKNWQWFKDTSIVEGMPTVIGNTKSFIDKHVAVAEKLNKPLVLEEFGLPRDRHSFAVDATTNSRNGYYAYLLMQWLESVKAEGVINGLNFWAFGGTAKPTPGQLFWKPGNDYMGDPPQEEQGLNAVFMSDTSTWKVIKGAAGINTKFTKPNANKKASR
jgi:mannan endo-1,4-beta-mannosidase